MRKVIGILGLMRISIAAQWRDDWDTAYLAGHLMRQWDSDDVWHW